MTAEAACPMVEPLTPDSAIACIADAATRFLGYVPAAVWQGCPILTTNGGHHWEQLDLGVFASPLERGVPESCCIGAHRASGPSTDVAKRILRDSGAGAQFVIGTARWWFRAHPVGDFEGPHPLERLPKVLETEKHRLVPARVLEVKRHQQGYLFDRIFPITHARLVEAFENACREGYQALPAHLRRQSQTAPRLCELALRMLCLKVMDHRGLLESDLRPPAEGRQGRHDSFASAWAAVPHLPDDLAGMREYLGSTSFDVVGGDVARAVYEALSLWKEYDYASVSPEMLGPFYQRALMKHPRTGRHDRQRQKEAGIFYTSRRITQTILDRLPIEELRPEARYILDPTCGSGSFMMAAEGRLAELVRPRSLTEVNRLSAAQAMIHGNDRDQFATEVARLAFVLAHPNVRPKCHFQCISLDLAAAQKGAVGGTTPWSHRPSVIVGNPPFKRQAKTEERAAVLMQLAVQEWLQPEGLLGLIMPVTFLSGGGRCEKVREMLLDTCELLEIWDLPRNILADPAFTDNGSNGNVSGDIESCAVLLRKRPQRVRCRSYVVGRQAPHRKRFSHSGIATTDSTLEPVRQAAAFGKHRLAATPVSDVLLRLAQSPECLPLGRVCQVWNGIQRHPEEPMDQPSGTDCVPWLQSAEGVPDYRWVTPSSLARSKFIRYPGGMRRPRPKWAKRNSLTGEPLGQGEWRERGVFAGTKVLIRKSMDPSGRRFLRAFIDSGHYPSDNFHFIWLDPRMQSGSRWSLEALLAVLNGIVADAWMVVARTINNPVDLVRKLPIPRLTASSVDRLTERVSIILRIPDGPSRDASIDELERVVVGMYPLPPHEQERMFEAQRGDLVTGWATDWTEESWPVHGVVEGIAPQEHGGPIQVTIRIPGFRRVRQVYAGPVPPAMPGWAMEVGMEFQAEIPWPEAKESHFDPTKARDFRPLPFAYKRRDGEAPEAGG